jgi:hypothetical protein
LQQAAHFLQGDAFKLPKHSSSRHLGVSQYPKKKWDTPFFHVLGHLGMDIWRITNRKQRAVTRCSTQAYLKQERGISVTTPVEYETQGPVEPGYTDD